jgi:curli production assembly/transport component CsgF
MNKWHWAITAIAAISMSASAPAFASELVYHPVSPTFGGNPLNGSFLLSTAQAQGEGTKSGQQGPDLSGLENALNSGTATIIGGNGSSSGGNNSGSGTNSTNSTNAAVRAARIAQPSTQTGLAGTVP